MLLILVVTCAEISIVMAYFQLCSEDYNWWWRAFLTSGSSALYLFAYAIVYFTCVLGWEAAACKMGLRRGRGESALPSHSLHNSGLQDRPLQSTRCRPLVRSHLAPSPPRSYDALADATPPTPEYKDTTRLEPFSSAARTAAVVAGYPKVAAIIANVKANANLQKYLAARPASSF